MARTADRTLTLVLDPDDDVDDLGQLRRLHARPLGQIVCEPQPGGGTAGLARSLLIALGKDPELGPQRDSLWRLIDIHLHAERVHQLVLLRAHTLTYPALRRLSDHTAPAGIHLWLVVHHERAPAPIAQLLEAEPHDTAPLAKLLEHTPNLADPADNDTPPGVGLEFPYLEPLTDPFEPVPRRPRAAIARGLSRRDAATVRDVWDAAYVWTTTWINDHGHATFDRAADVVYALARHGDTASEIYVRIRAALQAFHDAGIDTDIDAVDGALRHSFGEIRPCQFNATVTAAAALADQTPDPQLAALIVLAAVCRSPYLIRHVNHRGLASDGSVLASPWGHALAIPPELRRYLATWHEHHPATSTRSTSAPLFPGNSHGRLSQPALRRQLGALDAPASLWDDSPDTRIGEGPDADGRGLLHGLTGWNLWLHRRHEQNRADEA